MEVQVPGVAREVCLPNWQAAHRHGGTILQAVVCSFL
jgi:hypothetical protein